MTHTENATIMADKITGANLIEHLFNGREICIRNLDQSDGNNVRGRIESLELADDSGNLFRVFLHSGTHPQKRYVTIKTADKPEAFGLNHEHLQTLVKYSEQPPTKQELIDSFLCGTPLIGAFDVGGHDEILVGIITVISRGGTDNNFLFRVNNRLVSVVV